MSGAESSEVMSHAEVELYIQLPIFDTSVAVQMIAYVRCRKGLHIETGDVLAETAITACPAFDEPQGGARTGAAASRRSSESDRKAPATMGGMLDLADHADSVVLCANVAVTARAE
jgi:hypothetical protein